MGDAKRQLQLRNVALAVELLAIKLMVANVISSEDVILVVEQLVGGHDHMKDLLRRSQHKSN